MALSLRMLALVLAGTFTIAAPQSAVAQAAWTPERSLAVKRLSDLSFSPDGRALLYGVNTVDLAADAYKAEYIIAAADGSEPRTLLPASPHISSPQWSPDGERVAFLSSESGINSIWAVPSSGGSPVQITSTATDISSFKWAPDGASFAFVMEGSTTPPPIVQNHDHFTPAHLWRVAAAKPGEPPVNLTEGQAFSVSEWSGTWAYDWSPDAKSIVFAHQERPGLDAWTKARISTVDVATRLITPVETGNQNWTYFPKYSPDGRWIAFINAPGPFKWSFLWDMKLTSTEDGRVVSLPGTKNRLPIPWQWAPDSKGLFYVENDRSTYSFYRMPIDGSPFTKVFGAPNMLHVPGLNTYLTSSYVDVNGEGTALAFIGQTHATPPEIYSTDLDNFAPQKITSVNEAFMSGPPLKTERVEWRSLDGTIVEGLLSYPVGYEEGRSYPLVVQIHGGPNGVDFNEYLPLMKYFATAAYLERGYAVLRVNYRGTLGYGQRFREALIGNFGGPDYEDIVSGVNHAIDMGVADPDRLFVIGQSNGGTLTGWIITQTDRFKAACSVAGETDYISLEGTNGYFQTSWYLGGSFIDHLQMFLDRSPIFHVKNVRTPVLIQGGLLDDNVPFTQLEEFYRALKRVGADAHLTGYPGADHEFYPPKLYLRLLTSCLEWTEQHNSRGTPASDVRAMDVNEP